MTFDGRDTREAATTEEGWCPRLDPARPVLRRDDRELQFGLDAETGVILTGLPPAFDPLFSLIDGTRSARELRAAGRKLGLGAAQLDRVLHTLRSAGLLDPAGTPAEASTVRLVGAGPLGQAVAFGLAAAGPESGIVGLELSDPAAVDETLYPDHRLAGSRAEALRAALTTQPDDRARPGSSPTASRPQVWVGPHWSEFDDVAGPVPRGAGDAIGVTGTDRRRAAITIVAAETSETDRAITDALIRADQPHLVVRTWLGGVLIGPLVVPGSSPCLGCLDLTRSRADPAWPRLLDQLVHRPDRGDPVGLGWAAATVTAQVVRWLRTASAELIGATVELTPPDYVVRLRRWSVQPECGCSWPLAARWAS